MITRTFISKTPKDSKKTLLDCPHAREVYDELYDIAQLENNRVCVIFKENGYVCGDLRDDTFVVNWFFENKNPNMGFDFWDYDVDKIEYYDDKEPRIFLKF
tara:strand:- start:19347 stop:19649 length:303 start_codon:yes stop_codon:yes gene_type:complete